MSRLVVCLTVLFLAPALAGCLGEDDELVPFGSLGVPRWEAGYSWGWTAHQSGSWSYETETGQGTTSGEETRRIDQRVVNTERTVAGEKVYWLRSNEDVDVDGPTIAGVFNGEGLQAVGQDDLQPVARFYEHTHMFGTCAETSMSGVRVDPFPLLRFPLEQGAVWQQELEEHVTVKAVVLGASDVTVPAGTFRAVEVELAVTVDPARFEQEDAHDLRSYSSTMRVWYADEVRNIVRLESRSTSHVVDEGEGEAVVSSAVSLDLEEFSLAADVEEEVPVILDLIDRDTYGFEPSRVPQLQVVSDTRFPLNAANDSLEVTFGLSSAPDGRTQGSQGIAVVDSVPREMDWYDPANETIEWSFRSEEDELRATGPAVDVTLPPGGRFDVSVRLVPASSPKEEVAPAPCMDAAGASVREYPLPPVRILGEPLAGGVFVVEWLKAFSVVHPGPGAADHPLFDVPLKAGGMVSVAFDEDHEGPIADDGSLVLKIGESPQYRFDESGDGPVRAAGNASAVWEARARGLTGPTGITFGHSVDGMIHVRY